MNDRPVAEEPARTRSPQLLLAIVGLVIIGLVLLGNWQLRRLGEKLDLIERIDSRAYAPAVPAPGREDWPEVRRETHEYLRVALRGRYRHDRETLVQAVTELGGGYWVLTPLLADGGAFTLVNRGFVPFDAAERSERAGGLLPGTVEVTGLLRVSEPGGTLLRANDPAAERWYSRDVAAIARARGLAETAPYFVDADRVELPGGWPRGGMTRLQFRNVHLFYALTWYGLALTLGILTWRAVRLERKGPPN